MGRGTALAPDSLRNLPTGTGGGPDDCLDAVPAPGPAHLVSR
jgi:hypothetical protein